MYFFFQAEDGIRDVERSRGLGDVYKRQVYYALDGIEAVLAPRKILTYDWNFISDLKAANNPIVNPVSYTHLTLPTN